jgi:hypothetical protein
MPNFDEAHTLDSHALWKNLTSTYAEFARTRQQFLVSKEVNQKELLRTALYDENAWPLALEVISNLSRQSIKDLFSDLVKISSAGNGLAYRCHDVIAGRFDRQWVVQNIEDIIDSLIPQLTTDDEMSSIISLLERLDKGLVRSFCNKAILSSTESVRDFAISYKHSQLG